MSETKALYDYLNLPIQELLKDPCLRAGIIKLVADNCCEGNIEDSAATKFTSDIQVKLTSGKTVGKYTNGQTIPAIGKTSEQVFTDISQEAFPATASLLYTPSPSALEVGTPLSISFARIYTRNDGAPLTSSSLLKNGSPISNTFPYSDSIILSKTPVSYEAVFNSITHTGIVTYVGLYNIFMGPVSSIPTTSASVRSLASVFENQSITINTGTSSTRFALWIPNTRSLVSIIDLDALNLNITSEYVSSPLGVNDAGGNLVQGKLYIKTQTVPYSTNHRHSVTIN